MMYKRDRFNNKPFYFILIISNAKFAESAIAIAVAKSFSACKKSSAFNGVEVYAKIADSKAVTNTKFDAVVSGDASNAVYNGVLVSLIYAAIDNAKLAAVFVNGGFEPSYDWDFAISNKRLKLAAGLKFANFKFAAGL